MQAIFDKLKTAILNFKIEQGIDILLVAVLIYLLFMLLKKNNALGLAKYIFGFFVFGMVISSRFVDMALTELLFGNFVLMTILAVVLIFPQELKRGLWKISSPRADAENYNAVYDCTDEDLRKGIVEIVRAAQNMSKKNVGALIVIVPTIISQQISESGTELNAKLSCALIESIFNTKGPLHDGAVLVKGNRITHAGCFLPLAQDTNLPKDLGTRHRAAMGVTENSNVLTIICSEQTGVISVAREGQIKRYFDSTMLSDTLEQIYGLKASGQSKKKKRRLF